jgi:indoleamine 2,3-dioxygenase
MQPHMPPAHRAAIASFATGACIRSHAAAGPPALREAYNECVAQLQQFRSQHRAFAHSYIAKWAQQETTGTGGSDFMPALTGYRDTTGRHAL